MAQLFFFSIPTFYDYKKYNQQIAKSINNEFKVDLSKLEKISFKFIPSPHLFIKKAHLKIKASEKNSISELENIRVFISILELYKNNKFKINKIDVKKANFYLNSESLKNFRYNLKKNIVKNFVIKKSKLFFKNQKNEIILISTIKDFNYGIDFNNAKKILKIFGNIFDSDYEFKYLIDYKNPNIQNIHLQLKNPNLILQNRLVEDLSSPELNYKGNLNLEFLNQKNIINYKIQNNIITFSNKFPNNSNFDLNGEVTLKPFHFDLKIDLKETNLTQLENFLYFIYKNKNSEFQNLSGNLKINFDKINNKVIKSGFFDLNFQNSNLENDNELFYLNDFATVEISNYEYLDNVDQILQMKIKINILNKEKFNRFLFSYKKDKILSDNLYFTYQFNTNTKKHFISPISDSGFMAFAELYKFNNLQQLKNLVRDDNIFNLD